MRQDIKDILETRPIWQELQDPTIQKLLKAKCIAERQSDKKTVLEIERLIEEQKKHIRKAPK